MYKTEIKNPIHLVETEGFEIVDTFKSFDALARNWGWLKDLYRRHQLGATVKRELSYWDWIGERRRNPHCEWPYTRYQFILRDSFGDLVDPETVRNRYLELHPYRSRWGNWNPGSKRSLGHYFRRPQSTQERRKSFDYLGEDDVPKTRARRNFRHLPNAWDDIRFSHGYNSKNWKRYRKFQWK